MRTRIRRRLPLAVAILAATATGLLPGLASPASASTITGRAPGKLVTFGGKPVGRVLAVDPATASPKAGAPYGRGGRYRLSVPRGKYLVLAPVRGAGGRTLTARSRIFRLKAGQRMKVGTTRKTPKPRKKRRHRAQRSAHAAAGQRIKVSVFGSSVRGGGLEQLGRGVDSILVTDLFTAKEGIDCPVEVYEDRQSDGFRAIEQEIRLQRSGLVDPTTRVSPLFNTARFTPTVRITASLTATGSSLSGSIVARQITGGRVLASQSVARSTNSIIEGFPSELHALLQALCEPAPPDAYTGTVSGTGTYDATEVGTGNGLRANWNGTVGLQQAAMIPGLPQGPGLPTAAYQLRSGQLQYSFSGHLDPCDVAGSGSIDLGSQPDVANATVLQLFDGDPRTYQYQVPMPLLVMVTGTKSNCVSPHQDQNGGEVRLAPALGVPLVANAPLPGGPVGDDWSISGSGSGDTGPGSPDQTWSWSLSPSE